MSRRRTRARIAAAATPLLRPDERIVASGAVWMADRRPRIPLLLIGRAIYLLALTDQRVLVFDTPRRGRPLLDSDLLLARRHGALTLVGSHGLRPMLQVSVRPAPDRNVVFEFRPRDRRMGRALATALATATDGATDAPTDTPTDTTAEPAGS